MRLFLRLASAGVLLGSMTMSGVALAAPTAQDLVQAEAFFNQGNAAMKKSQWKEACTAFHASNDLDPSPGTQINLALCNEKQGKTATAWGLYLSAALLASDRGQKERVELARSEAAKLEPKLHKLVVNVKTPQVEGLVVTVDSVAMKSVAFGAELPIDPGEHAIEATAKGKKPFKGSVKAAVGPGVDRIEVPALEDDPNAVAKPVPVPVGEQKPQGNGTDYGPPTGQDSGSTKKVVGFVLGGAGVVLAGVAIVLEVVASSENGKSNDQKAAADAIKPIAPATSLTAQQSANRDAAQKSAQDHHDAAKNDQLAAIITGVGALALLGTGIYLIATSPSGSSRPAASLSKPMVVPILSQDTAGIGVVGRF